jgi:hypothetical protein
MRRRRDIWVVGLLAAAVGAAAVGVHASSATSTRSTADASTTDATYSCRVRRQHFIDAAASVTLPPVDGRRQPGVVSLTTLQKTRTQDNVTITVAQLSFSARKNSLRIAKSACPRVKQHIPLKPKGLSGPPITVTPSHQGFDNEQCGTTARVLVRLRLTTTNGIPSHALLAIRNDNAKRRSIAFYNWSPSKLTIYIGNSCTSS